MTGEELLALANRIDHEELWRRPGMEHDSWTPEQRDRHSAGVNLRRFADRRFAVAKEIETGREYMRGYKLTRIDHSTDHRGCGGGEWHGAINRYVETERPARPVRFARSMTTPHGSRSRRMNWQMWRLRSASCKSPTPEPQRSPGRPTSIRRAFRYWMWCSSKPAKGQHNGVYSARNAKGCAEYENRERQHASANFNAFKGFP